MNILDQWRIYKNQDMLQVEDTEDFGDQESEEFYASNKEELLYHQYPLDTVIGRIQSTFQNTTYINIKTPEEILMDLASKLSEILEIQIINFMNLKKKMSQESKKFYVYVFFGIVRKLIATKFLNI